MVAEVTQEVAPEVAEEVVQEAAQQVAAEVIEKSYRRLSSRSRLRLPARYHWLSDASDR